MAVGCFNFIPAVVEIVGFFWKGAVDFFVIYGIGLTGSAEMLIDVS